MNIGVRIRYLLDSDEVTQRALANSIHISASALNGYINKGKEPDYETLVRLADFFHTSTDYILGITNIRNECTSRLSTTEQELLETFRRLDGHHQKLLCSIARSILLMLTEDH